jgi:hypothetical protein
VLIKLIRRGGENGELKIVFEPSKDFIKEPISSLKYVTKPKKCLLIFNSPFSIFNSRWLGLLICGILTYLRIQSKNEKGL